MENIKFLISEIIKKFDLVELNSEFVLDLLKKRFNLYRNATFFTSKKFLFFKEFLRFTSSINKKVLVKHFIEDDTDCYVEGAGILIDKGQQKQFKISGFFSLFKPSYTKLEKFEVDTDIYLKLSYVPIYEISCTKNLNQKRIINKINNFYTFLKFFSRTTQCSFKDFLEICNFISDNKLSQSLYDIKRYFFDSDMCDRFFSCKFALLGNIRYLTETKGYFSENELNLLEKVCTKIIDNEIKTKGSFVTGILNLKNL